MVRVTPAMQVISPEQSGIRLEPCTSLSYFPAPRFCPAKVVAAEEKEVIATLAIPVIFPATEQPAIKTVPCAFTSDCIIIWPKEYSELLSPSGSPTLTISHSTPLSGFFGRGL